MSRLRTAFLCCAPAVSKLGVEHEVEGGAYYVGPGKSVIISSRFDFRLPPPVISTHSLDAHTNEDLHVESHDGRGIRLSGDSTRFVGARNNFG